MLYWNSPLHHAYIYDIFNTFFYLMPCVARSIILYWNGGLMDKGICVCFEFVCVAMCLCGENSYLYLIMYSRYDLKNRHVTLDINTRIIKGYITASCIIQSFFLKIQL